MFNRFVPKEGKFFDLFRSIATKIEDSNVEFRKMLDDMEHSESRARAIKEMEHDADSITHRTVELLHKTFITPLDRDDIHKLITQMDDIVDFVDGTASRIHLYDLKVCTQPMKDLSDICIQSAHHIKQAVDMLHDLSKPEVIIKHCVEINRLENDADHVLRTAMAKLFKEEPDIRQLIILKEIYQLLEGVTDRCEDVANTIESIVLDYA